MIAREYGFRYRGALHENRADRMARKIRCENYAKSTFDGPDFTRGIYLFWPRALSLSLSFARVGSFFFSRSRSHRSRRSRYRKNVFFFALAYYAKTRRFRNLPYN